MLAALAEAAAQHNYVKPHVHDGDELPILDGRHPVVERYSPDPFVPNDTQLDGTDAPAGHPDRARTWAASRPTCGRSRSSAIMAQAGSFVPAREAKLGVLDRVFARVGASDNIARGQSTFMVEMQETANILHSATSRSLVILDEIGRGTSTFDGLSIAWAVAEHLATNRARGPRRSSPRTITSSPSWPTRSPASSTRTSPRASGTTTSSSCARSSPGAPTGATASRWRGWPGMPPSVIARARSILDALEQDALARGGRTTVAKPGGDARQQLGLFEAPTPLDSLARRLKDVDVNRLTPLEALTLLADLQREAGG